MRWRFGLAVIPGLVGCEYIESNQPSLRTNSGKKAVIENPRATIDGEEKSEGKRRVIKREKAEHPLVTKMESIILPVVDFNNTTLEEAIDFLRIRSIELDPEKGENEKGVSFVVRKPRVVGLVNDSLEEGQGGLLGSLADPAAVTISSYYAKNISLMDALIEIASMTQLDVYLTTHGFIIVPEGSDPQSSLRKGAEILKVIRKSDNR